MIHLVYKIRIKRQESQKSDSYWQEFEFEDVYKRQVLYSDGNFAHLDIEKIVTEAKIQTDRILGLL